MTWLEKKEQYIQNIEELQKYFFYFSDDENIAINTLMETLLSLPEDSEDIKNIEKEIIIFQTKLNRVKSIYKYPYYLIKPSTVIQLGEAFRNILKINNSAMTLGSMLSRLTSEGGYYQSLYNAYINGTLSGMINIDTEAPIRDFAFYNFSEITGVSAPLATGIGKSAFVGCTGLETFYAPKAKAYDESFDKAESLVFTNFTAGFDLKKINKSKITYETWESTKVNTKLNPGFTSNSYLINLELTGVRNIGKEAFAGCTALKTVKLTRPDLTVEVLISEEKKNEDEETPVTTSLVATANIGSFAFKNCSNLTSVEAPYFRIFYDNAFENCSSLTEISFPRATELKNNVFKNCISLTKISMPLCKTIAINAFDGISTLESINIGVSSIPNIFNYSKQKNLHTVIMSLATNIAENAFTMTLPSDSTADLSAYRNYLTYCYAPALEKIQKKAFFNCINLPALISPAVSEVYYQAFANCSTLQFVNISQCKDIKQQAFLSCSNLEHLICPSLNSIGDNALQECIKLSNFYAPSCKTLGNNPFNGLENLKYLYLGEDKTTETGLQGCKRIEQCYLPKCTEIGAKTFNGFGSKPDEGVNGLQYVHLPNCTKIGAEAFLQATGLKRIYLPKVTNIGNNAFADCNNKLLVFLLNSSVTTIGTTPFVDGTTFIVPSGMKSLYAENNTWKNTEYIDNFQELSDTPIDIPIYDRNDIENNEECLQVTITDTDADNFNSIGVGSENDESGENYITGFYLRVPFYKQEIQAIEESSIRDKGRLNDNPKDDDSILIDDTNYFIVKNIKVDKDTTYRLPNVYSILELDKDKKLIPKSGNYHPYRTFNDIRFQFKPQSEACEYICATFKKAVPDETPTKDNIELWSIRDYNYKNFCKIKDDNASIYGLKFIYVHEDEKDGDKIIHHKGTYKEVEMTKYLYKSSRELGELDDAIINRITFNDSLDTTYYYFIDEDRGPNNNFTPLN